MLRDGGQDDGRIWCCTDRYEMVLGEPQSVEAKLIRDASVLEHSRVDRRNGFPELGIFAEKPEE